MIAYNNNIFVLSAEDNVIQVVDIKSDEPSSIIKLSTGGFSTSMSMIPNTSLALVSDVKAGRYSVVDLNKKVVLKTNSLEIPVSNIVVGKNIRKI